MTQHRWRVTHTPTQLDFEVVDLEGPSGGWPEVLVSGDPDMVTALLEILYEDDPEELGFDVTQGPVQVTFVMSTTGPHTQPEVLQAIVEWMDEIYEGVEIG